MDETKTYEIVSDILNKIKQHLININTSVILNSQENIKIEQNKLIKYHDYLCEIINLLKKKIDILICLIILI